LTRESVARAGSPPRPLQDPSHRSLSSRPGIDRLPLRLPLRFGALGPGSAMEASIIRWRAENEKTGYEHRTPVTAEVLAVLEEARMRNPRGGGSPVLPAPKDPSRCLDRSRVRVWWDKAQKLAGLEPKRGRGWHSLRRKFASDLMDQPLKVVCQLGGWKTAQTVLQCYQRADEDQLRTALEHRRRVRS